MFEVFLLLGRVCLRENYFFQMKEMPTGTIMVVQNLSGNKKQHWSLEVHKKYSISQVFLSLNRVDMT